ncbi:MAG: transglutaminase domain protein [Phenylobacterium sp.]|nr:transglutaminase domain protein [Phenylobacterium sp.]
MPVVSIRHSTTYRYRNPVGFGEHRMMLRPLEAFDQRLLSAEIEISPEPSLMRHIHDASGAAVGVARFSTRAERLVIESRMRVDHTPEAPFDLEAAAGWLATDRPAYEAEEAHELATSIARRYADAGEVEAWARRFLRSHGRTRVSTVMTEMMEAIRGEFAYALRLAGAPQSPVATLRRRQGSCRDFAVLMAEAARSLGLAAQFVSGYVYSTAQAGGRTGGGHTHAWVRVYLPGCGWVDFDPTNAIVGNVDLIRVAVVADPRLAVPLYGAWDGEAGDFLGMDVTVDISVEPEAQRIQHLRVAHAR